MPFKSGYSVTWDAPAPENVLNVPAQLGHQCRAAYFIAAREFFSGDGAIVDSGTLAGGSSIALLEGWKTGQRPSAGPFLYAFDQFLCDPHSPAFFRENFGGEWKPGDNFRRIYEKTTEEFADKILIFESDITAHRVWTGPEIEILGVDVWKTEDIAKHCVRLFFPHLAVGSIVLQQDYNHVWLPHIHRIMEAFSDHFEKIYETRFGNTVVFQTVRTFTADEIETGLSRQDDAEQGRLLSQSAARRARYPHTAMFIAIADCIREAKHRGVAHALERLDEARLASQTMNDEFAPFFAAQIKEVEAYIRGRHFEAKSVSS